MKSLTVGRNGSAQRTLWFALVFLISVAAVLFSSAASPARGAPATSARPADSSGYSQAVLADSPWGYWKLAQGFGFPDSSGNNRPMTLTIGGWPCCPPWKPGPTTGDTGPELRGNPNGFQAGDRISRTIASSDFSDNFTAELWVYPLKTGLQFLIGKGNPMRGTNWNGWALMLCDTNRSACPVASGGSSGLALYVNAVPVIEGPSIPLGAWSHVAVRRSGGTWSIYLNGEAFGSSAAQPNAGGSDIYFGLDNWSGGGFALNARVAHGAFYASALTTARLRAHYEAMPLVDLPTSETLGALPDPEGVPRLAANPSVSLAEPVNTATGSYFTQATDLRLAGIGVPFELTRTYNSADATAGPLGAGWTHNLAPSLATQRSGDIIVRAGDGQQLSFTRLADGSFRAAPGGRSTLATVGSEYELVLHDQTRLRFDAQGRLLSQQDRNGKGLTLSYGGDGKLASVTDSAGRTVTFAYASGLLSTVTLPDSRRVTYGYTSGRLTSVTDVRGGTTSYTYDGAGRLTRITDQLNHVQVTNTYAANGRVSEQVDARNNRTTFSWDAATQTSTMTDPAGRAWKDVYFNNVLQQRIDPLGNTTNYEYDRYLNPIKITDARGNATTMTWDSRGNLLTRTAPAPLSYSESFTYDSQNNLLSATNGRGNTTSFAYDASGNLTSMTQPGEVVTQFGRQVGSGLLTSVTDPRSKTTTFSYDAAGNLTAIASALGNQTTFGYDASGRRTSVVEARGNASGADPADYTWTFTYNNANQLTSARSPLGHTTSYVYDAAGNLTSRTDAKNRTTSYAYDAANHLISVTAPGSIVTSYAYDSVGNLTSRTDAKNHQTTYGYDIARRLTSVTLPGTQKWTYGYDANGNRISMIDANGDSTPTAGDGTTTYGYDVLNRLTSVSYSDSTPSVTLGYDANGNRTSMTDGAGTESYGYDALDRLTSVTRGSDVFSYAYDAASNLTQRIYPDGNTTAYAYDNDERLTSVTSGGETTTYGYDAAGNLTQTTLPAANGYIETRSYDRAGRLTRVKHAREASVLADFSYTLDATGNPTTLAQTGAITSTTIFGYDGLDRLTSVCFQASCPAGDDPFVRWTYDAVGNRLSEERPVGTTSYTYNDSDQLTQAGGTSYSYDANGNEVAADGRTFAYDLAGRLLSTTIAGQTTTDGYAGDGRRLSASANGETTNYLWDVNAALPILALERNGAGGLLRRYVYGADLLSMSTGTSSYYYHPDGLGSTRNVTSASGITQWTYTYEPFGTIRTQTQDDPAAPSNSMQFAGELVDDSGLYHLRARQYDTTTGRFLGRDPIATARSESYVSAYPYTNDRPTTLVDPSGLFPCPGCDALKNVATKTFSVAVDTYSAAVDGGARVFEGLSAAGEWISEHKVPLFVGGAAALVCGAVALETAGVGGLACQSLATGALGVDALATAHETHVLAAGDGEWSRFGGNLAISAGLFGLGHYREIISLKAGPALGLGDLAARQQRILQRGIVAGEYFGNIAKSVK